MHITCNYSLVRLFVCVDVSVLTQVSNDICQLDYVVRKERGGIICLCNKHYIILTV